MLLRVSASSARRRGGIGCCSLLAASEAAAGVLVVLVVDLASYLHSTLSVPPMICTFYYSADVAMRKARCARSGCYVVFESAQPPCLRALASRGPLSPRRTAA